jgi:tetratricopeptide (TPR) repeat protein
MIFALLLAAQDYSPETHMVMDRARQQAQQERGLQTDEAAAQKSSFGQQSETKPDTLPMSAEMAAKLQSCLYQAIANPEAGIARANAWAMEGGSFHALQCQGFAHARAGQWDLASSSFDTAATQAQKLGSGGDAGRLWAQAGNAALAGGKALGAIGYFDAALGGGMADGLAKGEIYLDRARANVSLGKNEAARGDMDKALLMAAPDPLAWLLSATLARRMNDLPLASAHINQAVTLAQDDAAVALEQGNIAVLRGDDTLARSAWTRAIRLAPDRPEGKAAQASITQLDASAAPTPLK